MDPVATEISSAKISSTMPTKRKTSKPMMEKKRRARINASLAELKSLVVDSMEYEVPNQHKLEKADILEITVDYLKQLHGHLMSPISFKHRLAINKYKLGFNACAVEVRKFFKMQNSSDSDILIKILDHLANVLTSTDTRSNEDNVIDLVDDKCKTTPKDVLFPQDTIEENTEAKSTCIDQNLSDIQCSKYDPHTIQNRTLSDDSNEFQPICSGFGKNNIAFLIAGNVLSNPNFTNIVIPLVSCQNGASSGIDILERHMSSIDDLENVEYISLDRQSPLLNSEINNDILAKQETSQFHNLKHQTCLFPFHENYNTSSVVSENYNICQGNVEIVCSSPQSDIFSPSTQSDSVSPSTQSDIVSPSTQSDIVSPSTQSDVVCPCPHSDVWRPW